VILGDVGVADAEGVDDGTVDVGQQGILDTETAGESRQKIRWIRADGVDFDAFTQEGGTLLLQLDQLRLAEASPGGGAVEQDERPRLRWSVGKPHDPPVGVGQLEVRDRVAHLRTRGEVIGEGIAAVGEFWQGLCVCVGVGDKTRQRSGRGVHGKAI
jgi:hypothetical protein